MWKEESLGKKIKQPSQIEIDNAKIARQVIVAKNRNKTNEIFNLDNLSVKRAGKGMSPMLIHSLTGQKSSKEYQIDDLIDEVLVIG